MAIVYFEKFPIALVEAHRVTLIRWAIVTSKDYVRVLYVFAAGPLSGHRLVAVKLIEVPLDGSPVCGECCAIFLRGFPFRSYLLYCPVYVLPHKLQGRGALSQSDGYCTQGL